MERVRKPEWLKVKLGDNERFTQTKHLIEGQGLHTICTSGRCPNLGECWGQGTATLMIAGEICTRSCKFCNTATGKPLPLDATEPQRVAMTVNQLKLKYAVITSVDRDDLPDMGANHWAETLLQIRKQNPETSIEVLIPDFQGEAKLIDIVLAAHPDVVGHNVETVRRLTPEVRSAAKYETSLAVLKYISEKGFSAKTGLMLGLGETEEELIEALSEIYATGCRRITLGQYLQPTRKHLPVSAYIHPDKFAEYKQIALDMGFTHVVSGPLVRSSYMAHRTGIEGLRG
ncbi:MAG: lipoyl synthase [Bacteroidota bacterium]|nr:lipoyl synthase [Bacteroidota bacterium]